MLTCIVHNSPKVCISFNPLNFDLTKPQRGHILKWASLRILSLENLANQIWDKLPGYWDIYLTTGAIFAIVSL